MTVLLSLLGLLAVPVLPLGTAVSVASEFSLTALERSRIEAAVARDGDRRTRAVRRAHSGLSFQLSGCQLGITVTTLATGYIAEPAIAGLIRPVLEAIGLPGGWASGSATALSLVVATVLSMVFGELVPKNLAIAHPLEVARAVVWLQAGFASVFRPLITGLNAAANAIVRRLGVEPAEELRSARSPGELSSLVRASAASGSLDPATAALLDRSLRFTDRTAEDLMTPRPRVETIDAEQTVSDLVALARRSGFSRFPVIDGDPDVPLGLVHVKQAFSVPPADRPTTRARDLARPVETVPSSLDGDLLMTRLRAAGLQTAVVVDEYGGTAGLVTMEDLLEEIVGDVRDEHDRAEQGRVRRLGDDGWALSGLMRPDEVLAATGFRMPAGGFETLAGLVLARLGRIPDAGDELVLDGWRLTVLRRSRNRVAEIRLAHDRGVRA
ncbi:MULTISPECIES: hemolysin family protein [Pseudonocardia]|uniref:Magnesium and cobalt efflux protein CorC n=1 Tax=Pseudonocardia autotrophica TaxID=2074 RepID=A0A1Y2N6J1_PSEAH|nr:MULTISPECIES: hemolysin family protein [Pseudonocardia]OSY43084.1 Magnesium and cobalt efflux protein CorC [Pseudonocardia autotrophica]TDN71572.1 CBS domain containing-hemolysin-like protein [Pseudonocardia autotrophica]